MATKDYTGAVRGQLKALKRKREKGRTYYYCECKCGNKLWLRSDVFINATSCGCLRDKKIKKLGAKQMFVKHKENNLIGGTNVAVIINPPKSDNTSGYKGVSFDKERNMWIAQITFRKKHYFLGRRANKEDAIKLRKDAEEKLFGNFLEWYKKTKEEKHE